MTTSWSFYTRGDLISAARVNAGGLLLGVVATVAIPWLIVSGWRGRWLFGPLRTDVAIVAVTIPASVILFSWLWRIFC